MRDRRSVKEKFVGATLYPLIDSDDRPVFFAKYKSASDFAFRTASVGTAPVLLTSASLALLLEAGSKLLLTFSNILELSFSEAIDNLKECGKSLLASPLFLVAAILSPLVNLIDLIGGAVNSLFGSSKKDNSYPDQEYPYHTKFNFSN
ncbi:hypothetical protein [Legionella bononiensis]|uniref:Integral membrane protein n=1 Tax=Legionella bononiensis TaxID=2793102 RepID=A0ABS1W716_9GAMM|nr:hypothetical protein [Legionella bononiensis]MBL7481256.1 hypothetical protein [Legionella bononiensis]MBL7525161.1 hypothetical protein [Legionella bononiensis]MBL7562885.1 hypothetical protein [Legionella bononiensis]